MALDRTTAAGRQGDERVLHWREDDWVGVWGFDPSPPAAAERPMPPESFVDRAVAAPEWVDYTIGREGADTMRTDLPGRASGSSQVHREAGRLAY